MSGERLCSPNRLYVKQACMVGFKTTNSVKWSKKNQIPKWSPHTQIHENTAEMSGLRTHHSKSHGDSMAHACGFRYLKMQQKPNLLMLKKKQSKR